jgi:beta-glucanase (GH16 family)
MRQRTIRLTVACLVAVAAGGCGGSTVLDVAGVATDSSGGGGSGGTGGGVSGAGGAASARAADAKADGPIDNPDAPSSKCPAGVLGHCSGASYPTYPGFTLELVEEFDDPLDLAADPNWTYSDGHGDGAYTRYDKAAITFAGGNAVLTATAPDGGVPASPSYAEGTDKGGEWPVAAPAGTVLSGELRTKHNNWRYGRFEARFKAAKNNNVISAFLTFRSPKWQDWREIDIEVTPVNPVWNCGMNIIKAQGAYAYPTGNSAYTNAPVPSLTGSATIYDDFHTYALVNEETGSTWYVDGQQIRTNPGSMEKSMKVGLNLWVFNNGAWGGSSFPRNTYPMSMLIDWVRLYKKDTDATYPCSPLPACQLAEDRDYQKNNAEDGLPAAAPW